MSAPSPPEPPTSGISYRFPPNVPPLSQNTLPTTGQLTPPTPPPGPSPGVEGTGGTCPAFPPAPPEFPPDPGIATTRRRLRSCGADPGAPERSSVPLMRTSPDASQNAGLLTLSPCNFSVDPELIVIVVKL